MIASFFSLKTVYQDKDSVSNNEDVNGYEVQNDEETITEDGFRKGLKFGGESTDVEMSLHEDFPAGGVTLSCLSKLGTGFKIVKARDWYTYKLEWK